MSSRAAFQDEANAVWAAFHRPVPAAALWYVLYYLLEVEGLEGVAFDFNQRNRQASEAFYWYGIFSIGHELANLDDNYFIEGRTTSTLLLAPDIDGHGIVREHAEDTFGGFGLAPGSDRITMTEWATAAFVDAPRLFGGNTSRAIADSLGNARDDLGLDPENPGPYIERVRLFFEQTPSTQSDRDLARRENRTGWTIGFNGSAWAGICEHLLRRDELSTTAWVDQSWSVEHNNTNWLDKMPHALDADVAEAMGVDPSPRFDDELEVTGLAVLRALVDVLDAAQATDLSRLFDWAEFYQHDVDVNLRRLRQQLGIE